MTRGGAIVSLADIASRREAVEVGAGTGGRGGPVGEAARAAALGVVGDREAGRARTSRTGLEPDVRRDRAVERQDRLARNEPHAPAASGEEQAAPLKLARQSGTYERTFGDVVRTDTRDVQAENTKRRLLERPADHVHALGAD